MKAGERQAVSGNTWLMLHESRFREHFEFIGNTDQHKGVFEGGSSTLPFTMGASDTKAPCC
jgi:hypothetical protein